MADPSKYPTRIAPYGLRMPPDLKSRIELSAKKNKRTLHAEIIRALEWSYPKPTPLGVLKERLHGAYVSLLGAQTDADEKSALGDFERILMQDFDQVIRAEVEKQVAERLNDDRQPAPPVNDDDLPF